MNLGDAVQRGWSIKRLTAEIAKCDILCSNCHRKFHWAERQISDEVIDEEYNKESTDDFEERIKDEISQ